VRTAKTRPALVGTADWVIALLPEDAAATLESWIKTKGAPPPNEEPPDESASPGGAGPAPLATPTPALRKSDSTTGAEKQKLDALINKSVPMPAPAAPANVPAKP
jgi:hypothetical protein